MLTTGLQGVFILISTVPDKTEARRRGHVTAVMQNGESTQRQETDNFSNGQNSLPVSPEFCRQHWSVKCS